MHTNAKKEPPEGGPKPSKSLKNMAGVTRLELAASGVTGRRSKPTELHPLMKGWFGLLNCPVESQANRAYDGWWRNLEYPASQV